MPSSNPFRVRVALASLALAAIGCAHPAAEVQQSRAPGTVAQAHVAAGCLQACTEATYVEVSAKGDLCRCWAPNAFQYTFAFPDTAEKLNYSRSRWNDGIASVHKCRAQGMAWEPSPDRGQIVCLPPSAARSAN